MQIGAATSNSGMWVICRIFWLILIKVKLSLQYSNYSILRFFFSFKELGAKTPQLDTLYSEFPNPEAVIVESSGTTPHKSNIGNIDFSFLIKRKACSK